MYRPSEDDLNDIHVTAASVEPMHRADHKSKRHGRPIRKARPNEKIGAGHFVFRRGDHGRVTPNGLPFEHPCYQSAFDEATRLHGVDGATFEVYTRSAIVDGLEAGDDWDCGPAVTVPETA